MALATFEHQPLPSQQHFRLVKFYDLESEGIHCSFSAFELGSSPPYYGVSYYWSDARQCFSITCDGRELEVTTALCDALIRLRDFRRDDEVRHLWIDQLCINQADAQERASQVLLMRRIYGQARRTLIWLGEGGDEYDAEAIRIIESLNRASRERSKAPFTWNDATLERESQHYGIPGLHSNAWLSLSAFCSRPWFLRLWPIQEAALSRDIPTLLFGSCFLPWDLYSSAMHWFLFGRAYNIRIDTISSFPPQAGFRMIRYARKH